VHVIENVIAVNHDTEEAESPTAEWEEKKKERKKKERKTSRQGISNFNPSDN